MIHTKRGAYLYYYYYYYLVQKSVPPEREGGRQIERDATEYIIIILLLYACCSSIYPLENTIVIKSSWRRLRGQGKCSREHIIKIYL